MSGDGPGAAALLPQLQAAALAIDFQIDTPVQSQPARSRFRLGADALKARLVNGSGHQQHLDGLTCSQRQVISPAMVG